MKTYNISLCQRTLNCTFKWAPYY